VALSFGSATEALDVVTGKLRGRFEGQVIAVSPDSKTVAVARHKQGNDGRYYAAAVSLWDPATGKDVRQLEKLTGVNLPDTGVEALAFSADGKTLSAVGKGEAGLWVRTWDPATGKALRDVREAPYAGARYGTVVVRGASPDGSVLALAEASVKG